MKVAKDLAVVAAIVVVLAVVLALFGGWTTTQRSNLGQFKFQRNLREARTLFPEFAQQVVGHWGDEQYWRRTQFCMDNEASFGGDFASAVVDLAFGEVSEYDAKDAYERPHRRCCDEFAD